MVPSRHPTPPALLPAGVHVADVAERCRRAALAFTNGAEVWQKSDLAAWLTGPYREATRHGATIPPPPSSSHLEPHKVEPALVDDILADAHVRVLTALENASISHAPTEFAFHVAEAHAIQPVRDDTGALGWAPINTPRMRLAYRVLSLFAADALSRPGDYAGLCVCHRCERVRFRGIDPTCGCTGKG